MKQKKCVLKGRAVKTTLVRNGVAIKELFENPNYDFNYQFIMDIEPTKLYGVTFRNKFCFFNNTSIFYF